MKDLNLISNELKMSTREIASLLIKSHSNIKISADRLAAKGTIAMQGSIFNHNGNSYTEYFLNKRDSLILVAQNSPEFTAAIVDRWQELENKQSISIPQTYSEALQLAADQAKQLEIQAPKVAFVDNLVDRKSLLTATQVGQKHKISAVKLNSILDEVGGIYNKSVKRKRVFTHKWVSSGMGEMKQTEQGHDQALFTNAGEIRINEILISEGIV